MATRYTWRRLSSAKKLCGFMTFPWEARLCVDLSTTSGEKFLSAVALIPSRFQQGRVNPRTGSHSQRQVGRRSERQLEVDPSEQPHCPAQEPILLSGILRILKART